MGTYKVLRISDKEWRVVQKDQQLFDFFNRKDTRWYYSREWTADYHFFDHNDLRYETMLRMVLPVAIRKTVPIIAK